MSESVFELSLPEDFVPILISVPHCGRLVPHDLGIKTAFMDGLSDCDVLVDRVYDFAVAMRIPMIKAGYSRYVIDLNRPHTDEALYTRKTTSLCPTKTFAGEYIYEDQREHVETVEVERRLKNYYWPYHDQLGELIRKMRQKHPQVLLYEAHSIQRQVALLDNEVLPDLMLGTNDQKSCDPIFSQLFKSVISKSGYSYALNQPFKGGHITRSYGDPGNGIHALQLERCYDIYLDEHLCLDDFKVNSLSQTLRDVFELFLDHLGKS
jgi:N-formylglutamate deformylase